MILQPLGNKIYTTSQEYEEKIPIRSGKDDLSKQLYGFAGLRSEERKEMEVEHPQGPNQSGTSKPTQEQVKYQSKEVAEFKPIGGTIYFTEIPKMIFNGAKTSQDVTMMNMDKTTILKEVLQSDYQGGTILHSLALNTTCR
jgi:hypothetical protein